MTAEASLPRWALTLYVNGASPRSTEAIMAVRRVCDQDLAGRVDLTVVDAVDHPSSVKRDQILALPTLVKHAPPPLRHLVGNLADSERVRTGLDLGPDLGHGPGADPSRGAPDVRESPMTEGSRRE